MKENAAFIFAIIFFASETPETFNHRMKTIRIKLFLENIPRMKNIIISCQSFPNIEKSWENEIKVRLTLHLLFYHGIIIIFLDSCILVRYIENIQNISFNIS